MATKKKKSKAKKTTKKAAKKKPAKKKAKGKTKRKPNAAFMRPLAPSGALSKIVGASSLPRTQAVKKIWAYIKRNGLQDKVNRREIHCDDKMQDVFNAKKITMFDIAKGLKKHLK